MRTLRLVARNEDGLTIVEMTIAMVVMAIGASLFGSMLTSSMSSATRTTQQSEAIDNLTLAMSAIGRELRSGQCITAPVENTSGTSLRFTSSANNTNYDVIYTVSGGTLTRQVVGSSQVTTVADHLVNATAPFQQIATPRRTVVLTFNVQTTTKLAPRQLTSTIAGRNAWRTCPAPL